MESLLFSFSQREFEEFCFCANFFIQGHKYVFEKVKILYQSFTGNSETSKHSIVCSIGFEMGEKFIGV